MRIPSKPGRLTNSSAVSTGRDRRRVFRGIDVSSHDRRLKIALYALIERMIARKFTFSTPNGSLRTWSNSARKKFRAASTCTS